MDEKMVVTENGEVWERSTFLAECPDAEIREVELVARLVFTGWEDDNWPDDSSGVSRGLEAIFDDGFIVTDDEGFPLRWPSDGQPFEVWRLT